MAGRTADISTSSFKPLSLNEIMMVPLAKQKMEDQLLEESGKFGALSSNVLAPDSEKASGIINDFKSRASNLSDEIMNSGVSRDQFNTLRNLKSDTAAEMGVDGFVGNAMANKKAAAKFVNDLATNKQQQQGWSSRDAHRWAQAQVGAFGGTEGENGAFNSFQGQGLATKVDEAEFIRKAIDDVAERVSDTSMQLVRVGGLSAFQKAFRQGKVTSKDFNEIMKSISTQAGTDVDLQNHLNQQAFFTGEKNPLDHGGWENVTRKDKDGTEYTEKIWKVGTSRFGSRMAGMADAADYRNITSNISIVQDKVAFKMWEMGMEEKQAAKMVAFTDGKLNNIKRADLTQLRKNMEVADTEVKGLLANKTKYENDLLAEYPHIQEAQDKLTKSLRSTEDRATAQVEIDKMKQEVLSQNKLWLDMDANYSKSAIKYSNSRAAIDAVYSIANKAMTPNQKKGAELSKMIYEDIPGYKDTPIQSLEEAIRRIDPDLIPEEGINAIGIGAENLEKFLISKYFELKGVDVEHNSKADRSIYNWGGSDDLSYDSNIVTLMHRGTTALDNKVENILQASPRAESFTTITAMDLGKTKSPPITNLNTLKNSSFNRDNITLAYGNMPFSNDDATDLVGVSKKGFTYTPSFTDSWDDTGNKFDNVVVKNNDTGETSTIQVINNGDKDNELIGAHHLYKNGTPAQQAMAKRVIAGWEYMPQVKASRMYDQNSGEIGVPIQTKDGKRVNVKWKKNSEYGEPFFTASIDGIPLNGGQAIKSEAGMVNVIYDYVNTKR